MEIIPAIDIKDGQCVRLYQGDFEQLTVYDDDPVAVARRWVEQGARRLHVVDLDGARMGHPVHADVITAVVRAAGVPVQLGGGLRDEATVRMALGLGVERVILGTAAVHAPELIALLVERYGEAIVVGVDARDGLVATAGWVDTEQVQAAELVERMSALGVRRFVYTDISRDGTLSAPNYSATAALVRPGGPAIIASGGVGRVEHLRRLAAIGCEGAVVGRALYTGALSLREALSAL
ncbi:MAG TPA: 1-(5-phosphoribosyl)-5-[(5-phosphoribosylamino)methylideneamino]imidazole-4-carboxamide isomerase [Roseiflexaceae bacterium]|nr:1-(5-phosphoribosyl)-5-[(5-phosphoribosylamino)methylideneamino]imidazole-4-carboxamide isomerase [Roseiflexaceae bacterium]